jgi:hypothetical protein
MRVIDIIRGAIPDADKEVADVILWGHTPYPAGPITAQSLYKAASRFRRAGAAGRRLCDWCPTAIPHDRYVCDGCQKALNGCRAH